jgi:hypothetical protein
VLPVARGLPELVVVDVGADHLLVPSLPVLLLQEGEDLAVNVSSLGWKKIAPGDNSWKKKTSCWTPIFLWSLLAASSWNCFHSFTSLLSGGPHLYTVVVSVVTYSLKILNFDSLYLNISMQSLFFTSSLLI